MAESILTDLSATKEEKYAALIPQWNSLIEGESNRIAVMANTAAVLHEVFDFLWVGFYTVEGQQLVLGPFHGPLACFRIDYGKGVCGTSWAKQETIIVPDVDQFPGHIACSSMSRSEIVVPLFNSSREVVAVLDIDSANLNQFDETDKKYLESICNIIGALYN